ARAASRGRSATLCMMKQTSPGALVAHICALAFGVACGGQGGSTESDHADSGTTATPDPGETNDTAVSPRPPFVEPGVEPDVEPGVEPDVEPGVDPDVEP